MLRRYETTVLSPSCDLINVDGSTVPYGTRDDGPMDGFHGVISFGGAYSKSSMRSADEPRRVGGYRAVGAPNVVHTCGSWVHGILHAKNALCSGGLDEDGPKAREGELFDDVDHARVHRYPQRKSLWEGYGVGGVHGHSDPGLVETGMTVGVSCVLRQADDGGISVGRVCAVEPETGGNVAAGRLAREWGSPLSGSPGA